MYIKNKSTNRMERQKFQQRLLLIVLDNIVWQSYNDKHVNSQENLQFNHLAFGFLYVIAYVLGYKIGT